MNEHMYKSGDTIRLKTIEELSEFYGMNLSQQDSFYTDDDLFIPDDMYVFFGNEYTISEYTGYHHRFYLSGSDGVEEWTFDESLVSCIAYPVDDDWECEDNKIELW